MGALIQKFYLKHYRIVNILLALTLAIELTKFTLTLFDN